MNLASAVELHFGIVSTKDRDGSRYAMRLTPKGATVGSKSGDTEEMEPISQTIEMDSEKNDEPHVVRLDRRTTQWWIYVDDQLLGRAPIEGQQLPEFRLRVEDGPAWFSYIEVMELEQRKTEAAS